jgi:hypothetical protein
MIWWGSRPEILKSDPSTGRFVNARNQIEQGRFAGAIRPDKSDDITLRDVQIEFDQRLDAVEVVAQTFNAQHLANASTSFGTNGYVPRRVCRAA